MPQVYLINLVRRPDRKEMMEKALSELGVSYKYFPAVDGKYVTLHIIIFSLSLCNKGHVKLPKLSAVLQTFGCLLILLPIAYHLPYKSCTKFRLKQSEAEMQSDQVFIGQTV